MPAKHRGAHLWLRQARYDDAGRVTHPSVWIILDGRRQESTECGPHDRGSAELKLERYLNCKHAAAAKEKKVVARDPSEVPVADVLALYGADVAPGHARPKEAAQKIARLLGFFGEKMKMLSDINGDLCREYAASRSTPTAAREDLVVLRSAINHHRREGHCRHIVEVVLPPKPVGRERWCTRAEVAKLIWRAWRFREVQKGVVTDRHSRRHVARFMLVALYSGTRAGAICGAALSQMDGRGWIDLDKGIFYRRPQGQRESKKRRPPIPLPQRLLAHLRRWKRLGQAFPVEWNGGPVKDVDKAFRRNAREAGLGDVTPHIFRHTCATWLMHLGAPKGESAGYLGMTEKQLEETYGHHHPDHLLGPRQAFDRPPTLRQSNRRTEREQSSPNVLKIADRSR